MNQLLENIFVNRSFTNSRNELVPIRSETSKEQCLYLQNIIREHKFTSSLEIGFAYGMSTLAIIEEVAKNNGRHYVIDKFQVSGWGGNGLDLIKQAGYGDKLEFSDKYCYEILPQLLSEGRKFDFAYIDSTKQLDWLLVDFFYIDKILKVGGVIAFDDVTFPGIRKLLRYISRFPNYKILSTCPANAPSSWSRQLAGWLRVLPGASKFIRYDVILPDHALGLNSNCVALQKIEEDKRNWDWHVDF